MPKMKEGGHNPEWKVNVKAGGDEEVGQIWCPWVLTMTQGTRSVPDGELELDSCQNLGLVQSKYRLRGRNGVPAKGDDKEICMT